uniref:Uncharacterized protein n=1 Tax=Brassica oleracea TaxID=3712 RepID=A0A3P6C528_BRAOL|nr:unnamed protein product [Brassica oleracea]
MGSSYRNRSAHMADIKGKGILFKDEPIKLTSQDNPKIFDGFTDRITANDLGNGKFLLNFTIEEDMHSVL